uniref:PaaI family thioesterase n=1 Tax=uncultured Bacteroides sp. TaxID=162156 RepID=UPI0025E48479|nr:DUF4442 domain-containing protein [uncultured Bacteroides sp.]
MNMDVIKLPFNQFIGLEYSDNPLYLLMLGDKPEYCNHLGTLHASAQFALAEATSGHYLLEQFTEISGIIPVVRKVNVKYRKPTVGIIYSAAKLLDTEKAAFIETLNLKGRGLLHVEVCLFNTEGTLIMQAVFEWFISKT